MENIEKDQLEVGDTLYIEISGKYNKIVIDRVTKTQAISGDIRLKRELEVSYGNSYYSMVVGKSPMKEYIFWLETEKIKGLLYSASIHM